MNHIPPRLNLSERISSIRAAASSLYDRGISAGISPEEVQKSLAPLQEKLQSAVEHAVAKDLPDCVLAVRHLECTAEAYESEMEYLMQKSVDLRRHAGGIKALLMKRMKSEGKAELVDGDFVATIVEQDGKEALVLR